MPAVTVLALALAACGVPKEKHQATLDELTRCRGDLDACKQAGEEHEGKIADLEKQLADMTSDRDEQKSAREGSEKLFADVQKNLKATREELEDLRRQRAEAEKRLQAFKALTAKFQKMIDSGKIKVRFRNGRMLVELPAGVLFASGKADLSKDGKTALGEVGAILKDFADRRFQVIGHTDAQPLRGSKYKDNWELSTERALRVTKFLIESGMNPANLSAAGAGEFDPVGDNGSEDGRQQNRRIEIVLVPNIDEMPAMPEDTK